jgi:hypothetical protein
MELPKDTNSKIWRYMDFTKFVDLLDRSALFFTRLDRLGDPFEGSNTRLNAKNRRLRWAQISKELPPYVDQEYAKSDYFSLSSNLNKSLPLCTAVNCWHINKYESTAMWSLYLKSNDGIAIETTLKRFINSLSDINNDIYISMMKYVDYDKQSIPDDNILYPMLYKRVSFEHEHELRAFVWKPVTMNMNGQEVMILKKSYFKEGIYISVDLKRLIKRVYIAPNSPSWILNLVRSIVKHYGLDEKAVTKSRMNSKPIY